MTCSTSTILSWIGFVLFNIGFVFGISYTLFQLSSWTIGTSISCAQTFFLYLFLFWLRKQMKNDTDKDDTLSTLSDITYELQNLLYLSYAFAVISTAAPGLIISFFIFKSPLAAFFSSSLPLVLLSVLSWKYTYIPTLPITSYIGIIESIRWMLLATDSYSRETLLWVITCSSSLWFYSLFFLFLTKRIRHKTYHWNLGFSSIVILISSIMLLQIFTQLDWWRWLSINSFFFIPLILFGFVSENLMSMSLGAVGIFLDIWRLAFALSCFTHHEARTIIYFGVFVTSGISLGYAGIKLSKRQGEFRKNVQRFANLFLGPCMKANEKENDIVEKKLPTNIIEGDDFHEIARTDSTRTLPALDSKLGVTEEEYPFDVC